MKEFKAVVTSNEQSVNEGISESQKRKLDELKRKIEARIEGKKKTERHAKQKEGEFKNVEQKKIEKKF